MAYFPLYIDLENKKCIVAGGGEVARRKIARLLEFGASVVVIAQKLSPAILEMEGVLTIIRHRLCLSELSGAFLVIAATDERFTNRRIGSYCKKNGIFVNVIDSKEESSFLFPALLKKEAVTIGITTSGTSPLLAGYLKEQIQKALPEFSGTLAESLGWCRSKVQKRVKEGNCRKKIYKRLLQCGLENNGNIEEAVLDQVIKDETKH